MCRGEVTTYGTGTVADDCRIVQENESVIDFVRYCEVVTPRIQAGSTVDW